MKKIALSLAAVSLIVLPALALAQISSNPPTISYDLMTFGQKIANATWIVFTIIAVIMFVVAGVSFLTARGDPDSVQKARQAFIWGIVGVVVAILAYTIITIVSSALR